MGWGFHDSAYNLYFHMCDNLKWRQMLRFSSNLRYINVLLLINYLLCKYDKIVDEISINLKCLCFWLQTSSHIEIEICCVIYKWCLENLKIEGLRSMNSVKSHIFLRLLKAITSSWKTINHLLDVLFGPK